MGDATDYSRDFYKPTRSADDLIGEDDGVCIRVYHWILRRTEWNEAGFKSTQRGLLWLDIGQAYLGVPDLAERLDVGERRIRTALTKLVRLGIINTNATKRGTVVTVVGFKETNNTRPADRRTADQPPTNSRPTADEQPTTTKNQERPDRVFDHREPPDPSVDGGREREQPGHHRARSRDLSNDATSWCKPGDAADAFAKVIAGVKLAQEDAA